MSRSKTKRNNKRKVQRMSIPELQKLIRVARPEIRRLSSMVAYAEHELKKRGVSNEHVSDAQGEPSQE